MGIKNGIVSAILRKSLKWCEKLQFFFQIQ